VSAAPANGQAAAQAAVLPVSTLWDCGSGPRAGRRTTRQSGTTSGASWRRSATWRAPAWACRWQHRGRRGAGDTKDKHRRTRSKPHQATLLSFVQTAPAPSCRRLERPGGTGPGHSKHRHRGHQTTRPPSIPWPASERRPRVGAAAPPPARLATRVKKKSTTDDTPATLRRPLRSCTALWCVSGGWGRVGNDRRAGIASDG